MIDPAPGVYAIMRGDEAILIAQAETGVLARVMAFEKSTTTGDKGNTGGQTFFRKGLTFDGLHIDVYDLSKENTESLGALKNFLITDYVQRTGVRPICNTRLPSEAKAYIRAQ